MKGRGLVWLDGALVPRDEASVSIDDLGFLYGAACFETMRALSGTVFRLERHLDRLGGGLAEMGVAPPSRADLRDAVAATLTANALQEARVRLTVSAGRGSGRPDIASSAAPSVLVVAEPPAPAAGPAALLVASVRVDEARPLARAKHANFLPYLLARAEARAAGCDGALMLNREGRVCEADTANVFAVLDGQLVTPSLDEGPLPGVTREAVLECAAALGLPGEERALALDGPGALLRADEVFLTSSGAGVRAISRICGPADASTDGPAGDPTDGRTFDGCPGAVTRALASAYESLVHAECAG